MDEHLLETWLEQGLSLNDIAALTHRDPSTVGYWVVKYGLVANGKAKYAPRGGLTHEQLLPLVERNATLREMAIELSRSQSTVRHWLTKHGLQLTRHHGNRALALETLAAGDTQFTSTCRTHGKTKFLVFRSGRHRCARCNTEAVVRRRRRMKQTLVDEAGGKCVRCERPETWSCRGCGMCS